MMNVSNDCARDIFQQQAKHFQHILNVINGSYGVINVLNPEGIYISCNTITEDNLQKYALPNYNNFIGKSIFDMVQPEFKGIAQYYLNCAKDCIDKDRQFVKDYTFSATGQRYEELFYYGPLKNSDGQIIGAISHMVNFNYLKQVSTNILNINSQYKNTKIKNIFNLFKNSLKEPFKELLILINLLKINNSIENKKNLISEMKNYLKILLQQINF